MDADTLLVWRIDATAGYDSAWVRANGHRLRADGRAAALSPGPYWIDYALETGDDFVHRALRATTRWEGGTASLELDRSDDGRGR